MRDTREAVNNSSDIPNIYNAVRLFQNASSILTIHQHDAVRIQVSYSHNMQQSDPPMRKYCFQYTIQITNLSENTIQLLSRRFEI